MTESKRGTPVQTKASAGSARKPAKIEPSQKTVPKKPVAQKTAAKKPAANKTTKTTKTTTPSSTPTPCVFMPTLLPDPFGETSPELCWEMRLKAIRVAIRLTQFGWNARVFGEGLEPITEKADHLSDLRELLNAHALPKTVATALSGLWVLAYDTAGF